MGFADDAVRGVAVSTGSVPEVTVASEIPPGLARVPDFFGPGAPLWLPIWLVKMLEDSDEPWAREIAARVKRG